MTSWRKRRWKRQDQVKMMEQRTESPEENV